MKELTTIVTRKGQVTVPAEIRRELGIKRGDKVNFILSDGEVRLVRSGSVVERTAGGLKSYKKQPLTAEQLREAAERAVAEEVSERSGL